MKKSLLLLTLFFLLPFPGRATTGALQDIYEQRGDLQTTFDEDSGLAVSPKAGFLTSLTDWAEQYGWREYPVELVDYAPSVLPPEGGKIAPPVISARDYIVVDQSSGQILAAQGADEVWPIASLTKLMTAQVALASGIKMDKVVSLKTEDDVGGAKLYVNEGTTFTVSDLFYAMLIGSANNAANAIARITGGDFIEAMNERAEELELPHTEFVDPTGIELGNVSTAREVALLADAAFSYDTVRRYTTTAKKDIYAISLAEWRPIKTTNWMLYAPAYDDVYVTSGKTGYLDESGWNLVVRLRPTAALKQKELLIVTFGSISRQASFDDADALANWVWSSFNY